MNHFKQAIKDHLDSRAKEDALFAKSYSKENKNIDECCNYIINAVKKTNRQGFADNEVFNMAIHYYDEDNLEEDVKKAPECEVVVNTKLSAPSTSRAKSKASSRPSKQELVEEFEKRQLSLF